MDHYSSLPEGTRTRFGRIIDYRGVRDAGGIGDSTMGLSGGQMQRIALYVFCCWAAGDLLQHYFSGHGHSCVQ